jgi:hypothetical protein
MIAAAHPVSGTYETVDILLVFVFLGALGVAAQSARTVFRKRRVRRSWLRDFDAEARERQEGGR